MTASPLPTKSLGKFKGNDNVIYIFIYTIYPYRIYQNYIHIDHAIYALGALEAQIKTIILLDLTIAHQNSSPYHEDL